MISKKDSFVKESKKKGLEKKNGVVRKLYIVKSVKTKSKASSQFTESSNQRLSLFK